MNLEKLREKRNQLVADMRGILDAAAAEDRDLTEDEVKSYDATKAEVQKLNGQIERLEEQAALEAELEAPQPTRAAHRQAPAPRGPEAKKEFESIGEFLHAVTFNPNDQRLDFHNFEHRSEQSMGEGAKGGFAIPQQFRDQLLEVSPQEAVFRPRAQVIPAGSPPDAAVTIPALDQTDDNHSAPDNMYGGVAVNWIAEGGTKPETDFDLREIKLEPHEVAGHIVVTDKLLRNWGASGPLIERLLRGAVIAAEEHAFMTGNGVGKPLGVVNAGAAYAVNRGTATTFKYPDAEAMIARLLMRGGSPVWIMSQSVIPQLTSMRNLSDDSPAVGDGALVWQPSARDGIGQTFLGYPVIFHERSPALGTKGDVALVDLNYYLIKDGSGPFVAASEHVHFTSNKTVIKIFWNVDGRPWLTEPLQLENDWDASPFVVLDVPG